MNDTPQGSSLPRLTRKTNGRPAAPVRIVHMGLGNFTRAHQAWYTEHAPDHEAWGIAAFSGHTDPHHLSRVVRALSAQDGVYTLIQRGARGDGFEVVSSLSRVLPGSDQGALVGYFRDPRVAIVTTTVTEAGYRLREDGHLDVDAPEVRADVQALKADAGAVVHTVPARVVAGLRARRAAGAGPITMLPCDNLAGNGHALHTVVAEFASAADPDLAGWLDDPANVSWATTMVDRITPATAETDLATVRTHCGYDDAAPVATEPFNEWVIAGEFPAGRPAWEAAGARFVADAAPYERRKLWLLNGAHTTLAYLAPLFGLTTVAQAMGDARCRGAVEAWWDLACSHLDIPTDDYRHALEERFANPNIRHLLAQIAHDGSLKMAERILPVARLELRAGRVPLAAARSIGAWVLHVRGHGAPLVDQNAERLRAASGGTLEEAAQHLVTLLDADLGRDSGFVAEVQHQVLRLAEAARPGD